MLLHPLDFLGADDVGTLAFFPAMGMGGVRKTELVHGWLQILTERFDVRTMERHAEHILATVSDLPERRTDSLPVPTRGAPPTAMEIPL